MEKEDVALKALEKAIGIEMNGRQFYSEAGERSTNQRGREMFLSLAHDEEMHLLTVEKQYVSLVKGEGWQALVEAPGEVDLETPLFPKGKEALEKIVRPKDSDLDALVLAMGFETDSYELYSKGCAETDDPNGKTMYKYLANMERGHFETLMSNYEYLSRTGQWHGG